ncbi:MULTISPECIES: hypothetical protein [Bacillus cereus group]|uniref:Uncharacterized protein n=1 Tax=Bacillus dicomae TaxID=3088378 RepID=A0AC61T014_9BACI|nr:MULTISPECIES: hypothetical protein [Bacillus cereus group]MBH0322816.1 hypothetical protein [Bacillus cereus]PFN11058.1 hypothetical protein COJ51_02115 [Bacillus thuringiensis]PFT09239.1 hypothetical protein COK59_09055 [Bacillus thuringiensis]PGN40710.1 hypothetical protein CN968_16915 [Bacillus thuringiensis]QEL71746.1 hypothetical protein DN399_27290 [Bacillus sp. AR4-2]
MNNWIFAILMLGVAIMLSMIATFFKQIFRLLKRRKKKEPVWITVTNAEYLDRGFDKVEGQKAKKEHV